jgi:hypothetical protein
MHFYMHSYVDKNFILVKIGCYNNTLYLEFSTCKGFDFVVVVQAKHY